MTNGKPDALVPDDWPAGPMAVRMMVGAELRRLREARGITRVDAGEAIRASHSKISRLELGRTGLKQRDVADLLTLYGVNDETERGRWLALAKRTTAPGWWRDFTDIMVERFDHYLGLEEAAGVIRRYEVEFVPDLLQTMEYARAVFELGHDDVPPREMERRLLLLTRRQQVLRRSRPARLWAIVDEAALRRQIDCAATMRAQLEHLIQLAAVPHITIQVMPFTAGHAVVGGPITLLRFPARELPDVVFIEQLTSTLFLEKPADLVHYAQVMDRLGVQADPPKATVAILRKILAET
ncbi:MAG TPA: helix-turn-helix transcriptional regulator [Streptosporangiaceae bacterium]|jgi:transcriptional regulator with XRE-family HTH domain